MSALEWHAGLSLSLLLLLRMLALFLLLPVLALAGDEFSHTTPLTMGIAFGIYGLTQALLQIPAGILSDWWGRKQVITLGLLLFAGGSLLAAVADSIYLLIIGRALQGAGAIAAAVMALAADFSRPEKRSYLMAIIGVGIGLAFGIAFIIAPGLYAVLGIRPLFFICALLAGSGIIVLYTVVPTTPKQKMTTRSDDNQFRSVMQQPRLWQYTVAIFFSHLILMADFTAIPWILLGADLAVAAHWKFYLPMMAVSVLITGLLLRFFNHRPKMEAASLGLCMLLYLSAHSLLALYSDNSIIFYFLLLTLFFAGFHYLEAFLPAMVSRTVSSPLRGAALGLYNTAQFIGIFVGGSIGGTLQGTLGNQAVFVFCGSTVVLWAGIHYLIGRSATVLKQ